MMLGDEPGIRPPGYGNDILVVSLKGNCSKCSLAGEPTYIVTKHCVCFVVDATARNGML
jgi:hypothetical protein